MKILHITSTHLNELGGVGVVLNNLIKGQNKIAGVVSALISINYPIDKQRFANAEQVPINALGSFLEKYKPDIAILHSYFEIDYCKVAHILVRHGIKYMLEPHGGFMLGTYQKSKLKKIVADHTFFRFLLKNAHGFIFLNESEKQNSVRHHKNELVIPNGINQNDSDAINEKVRNIKKIERSLFFIGRYDIHNKGLDTLLEALKLLDRKQIKLLFDFYGSGSKQELEYVNRRIANYHNIICHDNGPIFGNKKNEEMLKHEILLLTSRHEGFPMTVLEAWKMGIPCIVTPETNVADMVKDNNLGWVAMLSPNEIAEKIEIALDEYEQHKQEYMMQIIRYVNENFSWDKIAKESIEQISRVIS